MSQLRFIASTLGIIVSFGLGACGGQDQLGPSGEHADETCQEGNHPIGLSVDFGQRSFKEPIAAVQHPTEADFWYIGERRGIVWRMVRADGIVTPRRFLDARSLVNSDPVEGGLHGIALHPNFAENGFVYLSYSAASDESPANLQTRISRFQAAGDSLSAAKDSEEVLFRIEQPRDDNNGGHIAFGPDGFLYMGLGDGGGPGDPDGNAQNPDSLFGKVLRIDVNSGEPYGIPASNPFANGGGRPEIYASGFRNPSRFSFDSAGALWLGDVGQDAVEEVDIVTGGGNYGWDIREGDECFGTSSCEDFIAPLASYGHEEGVAITGGYVYRGTALPSLVGSYIFSDAIAGTIWALTEDAASGEWNRRVLHPSAGAIASLAQGHDGELFALDSTSGNIFEITEPGVPCSETGDVDAGTGPITSFQQLYDEVLSVDCAPCHTQRALGGLGMVDADTAFANLVDMPAESEECVGRTRVIPGDADNSAFFGKVSGVNLCGPAMPLGQMPKARTIEAIGQWIEAGAKR